MNKSYMPVAQKIERKWYVIDAENVVLGRLATEVATILRGKHKPTFTPNMDCGDYVIIVNAEKVALTGNKLNDKLYIHHTGYNSGLKTRTAKKMLETHKEENVQIYEHYGFELLEVSKMPNTEIVQYSMLRKHKN